MVSRGGISRDGFHVDQKVDLVKAAAEKLRMLQNVGFQEVLNRINKYIKLSWSTHLYTLKTSCHVIFFFAGRASGGQILQADH